MKDDYFKIHFTLFYGLICSLSFCQIQLPKTPQAVTFPEITRNTHVISSISNTVFPNAQPNGMNVYEQDLKKVAQEENELKQIYADLHSEQINYNLPDYNNIESTKYYQKAFNQLSQLNPVDFSIKEATFIIENAYFEQKEDYEEFGKIVQQTGDFLREKMIELGYDQNRNLAKNFMLFQFFADTLEIKSKDLKHLPFKYDFEDYLGINNWSNMFVSKLLSTGKGQCNSLPRLYLILAEEIGAEAFLSLSPNHSYIKFRDEDNNWYNVELTNGMFTTDSSILQSGFIKSEALQNEIYMQKMTKEQLLSQLFSDFAQGYAGKFGYDAFVKQVIDKALELYPNSISANMMKSNYLTTQFEYVAQQIGINPRNKQELQNIRNYPKIVDLLNQVNTQYSQIDDLGFEFMSPEDYQKWLLSLQETKQQKDDDAMKKQFNIKLNQTIKN